MYSRAKFEVDWQKTGDLCCSVTWGHAEV